MVNVYKLRFTNLQQEIMRVLFIRAGRQLNQRRIAVILGVSQPAVVKALPFLEKEGLIKTQQDVESKRWSIELNWENPKVIQMKKVDNLKLLYDSGLIDFIEKEYMGCLKFFSGDYSKGKDMINTVIDIAIVGQFTKQINLDNFEKIIERKIKLRFFENYQDVLIKLKGEIICLTSIGGSSV